MIAAVLSGCAVAPSGPELVVHGDSTAIASRIPLQEKAWNLVPYLDGERWFNQLGRPVFNDGVQSQSIESMRDKMAADRKHCHFTTVIYDHVNPAEERDPLRYVATLDQAVRTLETRRFLILPQVPNAGKPHTRQALAAMAVINREVLHRWPSNTFSLAIRNRFLAALNDPGTRADGLHRSAKGQRIEARFIGAWLAARGW